MKVTENKPHSIHLRLTDEQYSFCQGTAELMGVSVSDFVRMLVNGSLVAQKRYDLAKAEENNLQLGDLVNGKDNKDNK